MKEYLFVFTVCIFSVMLISGSMYAVAYNYPLNKNTCNDSKDMENNNNLIEFI